jgi:hypothetical protein
MTFLNAAREKRFSKTGPPTASRPVAHIVREVGPQRGNCHRSLLREVRDIRDLHHAK